MLAFGDASKTYFNKGCKYLVNGDERLRKLGRRPGQDRQLQRSLPLLGGEGQRAPLGEPGELRTGEQEHPQEQVGYDHLTVTLILNSFSEHEILYPFLLLTVP